MPKDAVLALLAWVFGMAVAVRGYFNWRRHKDWRLAAIAVSIFGTATCMLVLAILILTGRVES